MHNTQLLFKINDIISDNPTYLKIKIQYAVKPLSIVPVVFPHVSSALFGPEISPI
jgi:hypothetical protein